MQFPRHFSSIALPLLFVCRLVDAAPTPLSNHLEVVEQISHLQNQARGDFSTFAGLASAIINMFNTIRSRDINNEELDQFSHLFSSSPESDEDLEKRLSPGNISAAISLFTNIYKGFKANLDKEAQDQLTSKLAEEFQTKETVQLNADLL